MNERADNVGIVNDEEGNFYGYLYGLNRADVTRRHKSYNKRNDRTTVLRPKSMSKRSRPVGKYRITTPKVKNE